MFNSLRQSLARTIWPEVFEQARQSEEKDARIRSLMSELSDSDCRVRDLNQQLKIISSKINLTMGELDGIYKKAHESTKWYFNTDGSKKSPRSADLPRREDATQDY